MFEKTKEFIETWKYVSAVSSLNRDLKNKNRELEGLVENYKKTLISNSYEISNLKSKVELKDTELSIVKADKKVEYMRIISYLDNLEDINRSGLDEIAKRQNQNICINNIRNTIKSELTNKVNID